MALRCDAGCVPISSNLRMLPFIVSGAAIIGQIFAIFSLRTYSMPVPIGASTHLCSEVP